MKVETKGIKSIVLILISLFTVSALVFASTTKEPNYISDMTDEELMKEYQKSYLGENPIHLKYIYDVLYVGMPKEEFVDKFTKNVSYEGTARPYIFNKEKDVYCITFPDLPYLRTEINLINRITFKEGKLIKYEIRHMNEPPFMWCSYSDYTDTLKGFVDVSGFYRGMSEEEFLKVFSDKIIRHSEDQYIFIANNGKKYLIRFENGKLCGIGLE